MTTPQSYAPRPASILDTLGYTQRVVDAILRNNPLVDAVVSQGLIQWVGNYAEPDSADKRPFVWIGQFSPSDTNLPGNPGQMGVVFLRDWGGPLSYAFALYDHSPSGGGGLRPTVHVRDANNDALLMEARNQGGLSYPSTGTGWTSRDARTWPKTDLSTADDLMETHIPITGARMVGFLEGASFVGGAGEITLRVDSYFAGGPSVESPPLTVPANSRTLLALDMDVSALVGDLGKVYVMARRTNGTGEVGGIALGVHCRSTE